MTFVPVKVCSITSHNVNVKLLSNEKNFTSNRTIYGYLNF